MVIAADYPFLDVLWTMILFFTWLAWIWMMVMILADVFRRRDIGGWAKAGWAVFLIVLPFVGALAYLISQHDEMAERQAEAAGGRFAARDAPAPQVAAGDGPASEIASA